MFNRYFKDHITKLSFMLMIAIFFASATPRHTIEKKYWGFPFIYQFRVKEQYIYPGIVDKDFNFLVLVVNILLLFIAMICAWYIYRFVWERIQYFSGGLQ